MNYTRLVSALNQLEKFCWKKRLNFVVVGSVAYKNAYSVDYYNKCDDIDCVFIYDDIKKVASFPQLKQELYLAADESLRKKEVDLFATKFELEGIQISLDFISTSYFKDICNTSIDGRSIFLRKMTDAEENPTNDYYDLNGNSLIYEKQRLRKMGFNVYLLPTCLFHEGSFFSGVLRNKFIHNPLFQVVANEEILDLKKTLLDNQAAYYKERKQQNEEIDITKSIRRWDKFSDESKMFIKSVFK